MNVKALRAWFQAKWHREPQRRAAALGYQALGRHPETLMDIALRGYVFTAQHEPGDPYATARNAGRHELALEIIELAGADPQLLLAFVVPNSLPDKQRRMDA